MKAALYVRVSTEEQKKGLSIDTQIAALEEYCDKHDYNVYKIYNDAGISARKKYTKRPQLMQLIEDCKSGNVDIILFTRLDRWFRNVASYYEVQEKLDQYHVCWKAIWEDYETQTSSGIFKVNIMLSVNQAESDRIRDRVHSIVEYKKSKGEHFGRTTIGYIAKDKHLIKDEKTRDAMQAFWDTLYKTMSIQRAIDAAADNGIVICGNSARVLMTKRIYSGQSGHETCEPYISPEHYDEIMRVMRARTGARKAARNRTYIFSGLVQCGYCGHKCKGNSHAENRMGYVCLGHSRDPHPIMYKSERVIEAELLNVIAELVEKENKVIRAGKAKGPCDVIKAREKILKKIERLNEVYIDGEIEKEKYKRRKLELQTQLDTLVIPEERNEIVLAPGWRDAYYQLDAEHKKTFWSKIIKSITIYRKKEGSPKVELL